MTSTTSYNNTDDIFSNRDNETAHLLSLAENIKNVYIWVVFAVGFPGNAFSIITVLTMQQMTTATFFVSLLAFYDACTLTVKLVYHQMFIHNVYMGSPGCKMAFLSLFFSLLANWTLVFICAERFIAVCFPLKKAYIVTKRRSYICSAALFVVLLISLASMYALMRDSDGSGMLCGTFNEYLYFWTKWWYWINALLYLFLPFSLIVVLTSLIIKGLSRSRVDRRSIMRNSSKGKDGNKRLMADAERQERSITIMLISVALIFLILLLPTCVFILTYSPSEDTLVQARWKVFDQIQFILADSSHAVNFFLYFFSAQRFRHQFFRLFLCRSLTLKGQKFKGNESTMTKFSVAASREDESCV
ncbi:hypothetical protein Btru_076665 [Bulinus truncatus]|nr:hypothetical protein Btru_076665 [Bulinus truncatus]